MLIVPPIRTATRSEDSTLALAVAVGHFVQVGLPELDAMSGACWPSTKGRITGNPHLIGYREGLLTIHSEHKGWLAWPSLSHPRNSGA